MRRRAAAQQPTELLKGESPPAAIPECLDCGTCCFSRAPKYLRVSGDDYSRLGPRAEELVSWDGNRAYMELADGHCAALVVEAKTGRFRCGVYPTRPETCRQLQRGSGECAGERHTKAERPLIALRLARGVEGVCLP